MKNYSCFYRLLKSITALCFIILSVNLNATYIDASEDICIGNLAYFKLKGTGSVTSVNWAFGDGYTSKSQSPFHLYKQAGSYWVKVEITTNTGQLKDSLKVTVHDLPEAKFNIQHFDSCFYSNELTLKDVSNPSNVNNPISKRLIVWGDGEFSIDNNWAANELESHQYKMMDKYKIKMEITDNKGCKSSYTDQVKIIHGTKAKINHTINYPTCGEAEVCFTNGSSTTNGLNQTYIWSFDGGSPQTLPLNQKTCYSTKQSKVVKAQLQMSNPDNTCLTIDSISVLISGENISGNWVVNDSLFCYGSGKPLNISAPSGPGYSYEWYINNVKTDYTQSRINQLPKGMQLFPGTHQIECIVSKGGCKSTFKTRIKVIGPVARMHVFNDKQCDIDSRVFFIDTSLNLNRKHATYRWTVIDPDAPNCEIFRAQNKNKYQNCNISLDWFGKHDYTIPRAVNPIFLTVSDTLIGCSDSTGSKMEHFHCLFCNRQGTATICQGDTFLPLKKNEIGPKSFSLDSGKTWMKFPSQINKPYKGLYGVLFAFEFQLPQWAEDFGDDSIKVHRDSTTIIDTIFTPDFLYVRETLDTALILSISNICKPFEAKVEFVNPNFKAGDRISIDWKDSTIQDLVFYSDTVLTFIKHIYNLPGLDTTVQFNFYSNEGCMRSRGLKIRFGKGLKIQNSGLPCINQEICFNTLTNNWLNNQRYSKYKSIKWFSSLDNLGYSDSLYCRVFKSHGLKTISMIYEDSFGCLDTLNQTIHIRELKAGIYNDSRISICSELKQMFDSSYYVYRTKGDNIVQYIWDFGSGKFTTFEKDPFRSFDVRDSLIKTKHIVIDNNGCTDTISYDLIVVGSVPQFELKDTIGCAPLTVTFKNTSYKCSKYIWEFGDENNTTQDENIKKDASFIYEKSGKYYPKLIGIDTFFNPYTGSVYYCHETYDPKVAVTVFETKYAKFTSPDTICLGEKVEFVCTANTLNVRWNYGDGNMEFAPYSSLKSYTFNRAGNFKVEYAPVFNFQNSPIICKDSFSKTITVVGVKADFEIKSNSQAPIFHFKSLSDPYNAGLNWDFGDPSSSSNYATDQEPSHNYGYQKGRFNVCLTATLFSCKDSVCKPIMNDYEEFIKLYNVFTPQNADGMNDEYEVSILGEDIYQLTIYDRWGVVVYSSNKDGETGDGTNWNGLLNNTGNACPSGTYYYVFTYSFFINPEKIYTTNGTITLIR